MTKEFPSPKKVFTKNGDFYLYENGQYLEDYLIRFGEFSESEHMLFKNIVREGHTVLDVGANIGVHSRNLSNIVKKSGHVIAIEPQPSLYHILSLNMKLSTFQNYQLLPMALGNHNQNDKYICTPDYINEFNYGGVALNDNKNGHKVRVQALDNIAFSRRVNFVKIDVEGMEEDVIKGGLKFIQNHKPILYIEADRAHKFKSLLTLLFSQGYRVYWHSAPALSEKTQLLRGHQEQELTDKAILASYNILCVPSLQDQTIYLPECTMDEPLPCDKISSEFRQDFLASLSE